MVFFYFNQGDHWIHFTAHKLLPKRVIFFPVAVKQYVNSTSLNTQTGNFGKEGQQNI